MPEFQTPAGALEGENRGGPAERDGETRSSSSDGDADLLLLDRTVLGQLRALNAAKKGDFLKRVVDLYREHAPTAYDQLRQHAKADEVEACRAMAHSLKFDEPLCRRDRSGQDRGRL